MWHKEPGTYADINDWEKSEEYDLDLPDSNKVDGTQYHYFDIRTVGAKPVNLIKDQVIALKIMCLTEDNRRCNCGDQGIAENQATLPDQEYDFSAYSSGSPVTNSSWTDTAEGQFPFILYN